MIRDVLSGFELAFEYDSEFEQYLAKLPGGKDGKSLGCTVRYDRSNKTVVCTVMRDRVLSDEYLPAVVEFVIRVNFNLSLGSFDVDLETGMIQFRTAVCFFDAKPNAAMIGTVLRDAIESFRFFHEALNSVDEGRAEAFSAYDAIWDSES